MRRMITVCLLLFGCNSDPGEPDKQVGYRDGIPEEEGNSGERGTVKITEVLWSGSVTDEGAWDPTDVFVELRNEGNRPVDITGWELRLQGGRNVTFVIPPGGPKLQVGAHAYIAAKTTGCFPEPDWVMPELAFSYGDPFRITLHDRDERLIEPAGNRNMPPFAGGYDLVVSRSMEKVELMFGGRGSDPHAWHHYTAVEVDVPNNDRVAEHCRERTLASPGRPNSPDYSGAYASGSFE